MNYPNYSSPLLMYFIPILAKGFPLSVTNPGCIQEVKKQVPDFNCMTWFRNGWSIKPRKHSDEATFLMVCGSQHCRHFQINKATRDEFTVKQRPVLFFRESSFMYKLASP